MSGYQEEKEYSEEELKLCLDDGVDYRTGEIMGAREYEAGGYGHPQFPVEDDVKAPGEFSSVAQMGRHMEKVDKRRLKLLDNCTWLHDFSCGRARREGRRAKYTVTQYRIMARLVSGLDYRNLIFADRKRLAGILGVNPSHVRRTLKKVEGMVKVVSIRKGEYKVEVSPAFGWKHYARGLQASQKRAVSSWYRPSCFVDERFKRSEEHRSTDEENTVLHEECKKNGDLEHQLAA